MTIIVATRKCMAADHKVSGGSTAPYYTPKIFRHGDHIMGAAGTSSATTKWFEWMRRDCPPMEEIDLAGEEGDTFIGLVLNEDGLFVYNAMCEPDPLLNDFYAIGSGSRYVMQALKAGKSPESCVRVACEFDDACGLYLNTGPTVLTVKPKANKTRIKYQKPTPPEPSVVDGAGAA